MGFYSTECSHCGSKEHASKDCPHEKGFFSSETKCRHCGSNDHASESCPHEKGFFFGERECRHCGSREHASRECPHGFFSSKCNKCGSREHATEDCPHGFLSTKCAKCGSKNHSTDNCPHGSFGGSGGSSFGGNNPGLLGWLIGLGLIAFAVYWLAVNILIPGTLLNLALIFSVIAWRSLNRRTIFAVIAVLGGCYLFLDVSKGWFSESFLRNILKERRW